MMIIFSMLYFALVKAPWHDPNGGNLENYDFTHKKEGAASKVIKSRFGSTTLPGISISIQENIVDWRNALDIAYKFPVKYKSIVETNLELLMDISLRKRGNDRCGDRKFSETTVGTMSGGRNKTCRLDNGIEATLDPSLSCCTAHLILAEIFSLAEQQNIEVEVAAEGSDGSHGVQGREQEVGPAASLPAKQIPAEPQVGGGGNAWFEFGSIACCRRDTNK